MIQDLLFAIGVLAGMAALIPVGILFALMGAVEGTFVGLLSAQLLAVLP